MQRCYLLECKKRLYWTRSRFILRKAGTSLKKIFFKEENEFVYCHNISDFLQELWIPLYSTNYWRLFLDCFKRSLKCFLHDGNVYAAVPVDDSVFTRRSIMTKTMIERLEYHEHNWTIGVDFKMVNFLLGRQIGFTKFPCFLLLVGQLN